MIEPIAEKKMPAKKIRAEMHDIALELIALGGQDALVIGKRLRWLIDETKRRPYPRNDRKWATPLTEYERNRIREIHRDGPKLVFEEINAILRSEGIKTNIRGVSYVLRGERS